MENLFRKHEKKLRKVNSQEKILKSVKRVNVFKGADFIKILESLEFSKDTIKEFMIYLLVNSIILKVQVNDKNKNCDLLLDYRYSEKDYYIWSEEKSSHFSLLIVFGIIFLGLALGMFQMWPSNLKFLASYASYLCGAFIAFLLLLGVIRLIIFSITYFTHSPGIWLFPNLFADCGFVDSFIPLWCYHGENVKKEKFE